jgi:polyhydroxyalkanoate synthesis regulator phasin
MLEDMRRNVRGLVEAAAGAVSGVLTPSRAREAAKGLALGEGRDQVNRVAQELLEWSQRSREWITETIQKEVKRQLAGVGIATREDLDALRKRVRELERSGGSGSKAAPKKSGASRTRGGTRKSSAKTSSSERTSTDPVGDAPAATGLGDPGAGPA